MSDIEIDATVTVYCDAHEPNWLQVTRYHRDVYPPETIARVRDLGIELPETMWIEEGVSSKKEERWAASSPGRFARRGVDIPMTRKVVVGNRAVREEPADTRDFKSAYIVECRRCPRDKRVNVPLREESMQMLMEAIVRVHAAIGGEQPHVAVTIRQLKRSVEKGVPRHDTPEHAAMRFLEQVALVLGYTPGSEPGPGTV